MYCFLAKSLTGAPQKKHSRYFYRHPPPCKLPIILAPKPVSLVFGMPTQFPALSTSPVGDRQGPTGGLVLCCGAPLEINSDEDIQIRSNASWYRRLLPCLNVPVSSAILIQVSFRSGVHPIPKQAAVTPICYHSKSALEPC